MIKVTWEWLGQGLALDLADTVTIEDGTEHDLIDSANGYARWAAREAAFLPKELAAALDRGRSQLLDLRATVRDALAAVTAGVPPPLRSVDQLNRASRSAPTWTELDPVELSLRHETSANKMDVLLASYARATIDLLAKDARRLRRCPAPSCGMFFLGTRPQQRWCSIQCGSRARVARHYKNQRQSA